MTALVGCPFCKGWMRWSDFSCNECNGTNTRKSYEERIGTLAANLRVAALEEARFLRTCVRLSTQLRARAKECGNGVAAALDAVAESVEGES